jgi:3'-phosphoadenosine 5'-phosphosulfate sulfotransferase (PAPS reductase)/FAD synthetase
MRDPFLIDGPTCVSFSGGRTSAYMLWRVLQANGGLPADALVCFANTGKEVEATLQFVDRCSREWGVPIAWLEFVGNMPPEKMGYRVVNFATAARQGEPFESLIRRRNFLPNPVSRFCTSELKIRTMHRYIRAELAWPEWDQFIGIRADEQRRVSKIRARGASTETKDETMCMPLADAGISVQDVGAFWDAQPFNLELLTVNGRTLEGNCDYCFLKPPAQRLALASTGRHPIDWWVRMESGSLITADTRNGARFCKDGPTYAQIEAFARDQRDMFDPNEEAIPCFCGD